MQVDPENHHSFRKHLRNEGFMDKIQMPPTFVKENKKKLGKTCLLKTDVDDMFWEVKIVRENSDYFICGGDWPHFVGYHKLKVGEILIFYLIDKSTFQVVPYIQKSCKNLRGGKPFEELSSSENEEDAGPSRRAKKVKMDPIVLSDSEEENIDPSGGGNSSYSLPGFIMKGGKFDAKANSMLGLRKKAPETKKAKKAAKDPNKPKRPASAFLIFLKEIGKQFKKENRGIKSVVAFGRAGGDKWKQMSDAEKAPYMAEAKKRMKEYKKNKN
ncbi:hypothetical protein A4A49_35703 [Nicotiana attenuata]|uniref:B3 domain-containing protein n=1 Tax=Nicotiana attenuata TaxID=49451 RepID=A0A1J6JV38_NICAT|nr:hypothetical protein A4A49_35703 [Nicotiana attenuata]